MDSLADSREHALSATSLTSKVRSLLFLFCHFIALLAAVVRDGPVGHAYMVSCDTVD